MAGDGDGTEKIVALGVFAFGISQLAVLWPHRSRAWVDGGHLYSGRLRSMFGGSLLLAWFATAALLLLIVFLVTLPLLLQRQPEAKSGYPAWTPSSINFCEGPDFEHLPLVAEPVNTMSSFVCFCLPSLAGLLLQSGGGRVALRFHLTYLTLFLVGFGSAALHASLLAVAQAGDELPMIYIITMLTYCAACDVFASSPSKWSGIVKTGIPLVAILATIAYCVLRDVFAFFGLFFLGYIILFWIWLYLQLAPPATTSAGEAELEVRRAIVVPLVLCNFTLILVGCLCWSAEMGLCEAAEAGALGSWAPLVWHYGMHTGWHLCSGLAAYVVVQVQIASAMRETGAISLDWTLLPHIVVGQGLKRD